MYITILKASITHYGKKHLGWIPRRDLNMNLFMVDLFR